MEQDKDALRTIENEINIVLANGIERYGIKPAMGALVSAAAGLVASLDRNPLARALAAWNRTFSMAYDAHMYHPVPTPHPRPAGEYDA